MTLGKFGDSTFGITSVRPWFVARVVAALPDGEAKIEELDFLTDTGGSVSTITKSFCKDLNLISNGDMDVQFNAGLFTKRVHTYTHPTLQIHASINEDGKIKIVRFKPEYFKLGRYSVLGGDFFKGSRLEVVANYVTESVRFNSNPLWTTPKNSSWDLVTE